MNKKWFNNKYNINFVKLIKSISTKTVNNLERIYYLYVGEIR